MTVRSNSSSLSILLAVLASVAVASPGGLDENGCHVDSTTQERHCHAKRAFNASKPALAGDEGVLYGPLVRVTDGDTLYVKIQGYSMEFRLADIDAPESDQPYGKAARERLIKLIGKRQCVLVPIDTDRYGRTVAHLWVGTSYVNREMVASGAAWFDGEFAATNLLYDIENAARDAKRGLWALPLNQRIEPAEWRRAKRERATSTAKTALPTAKK